MDLLIASAAAICLLTGIALLILFKRLIAGPKTLPVSVDWIQDLSAARYRPMERLLNGDDYRFLSSQPGYDRKLLKSMRSERRRLFRGYLACLRRDFSLVGAALRLVMMYSMQERPDLARILFKQQMLFTLGTVAVEWHLALHACGIGTVDVSPLVRVMDLMRLELRHMIPVESGAAA